MSTVSYDEDFFEWALRSAELIRSGDFRALDREHVAEEIEDLAKRDRREAASRLTVLVKHLLKWRMQPERRETSTWRSTINTQRMRLRRVLADSPSLRRYLGDELPSVYADARDQAMEETGLTGNSFELECPFPLQQVLDNGFFPD